MDNLKLLDVSVVICCYNSAKRLPETLRHLLEQDVPEEISWEVIVVDNASTDNTSEIARSLWPNHAPAPLRVVKELEPGLCYARMKGIAEAKYEIVSFLDDDNWAVPNWVKLVSETMRDHPEVGACGGRTEAETEIEPPTWFNTYSSGYVIGKQFDRSRDITWSRGWLWGAGLTIRKKAWDDLTLNGFKPILSGRFGNIITSGEDVEICYALRLVGWHIWYSDELVLKHYISKQRLTTTYLSKLQFGFGTQTIGFDPYNFYAKYKSSEVKTFLGKIWLRQLIREIYFSLFMDGSFWKKLIGSGEKSFNHSMIWLRHWGRITALLKNRKRYDHQIQLFDKNNWIRIERQTVNYLYSNPGFGDAGNPNLSSNPLVTVLICNYNYGRYLSEAIESALNQTWKNLEVIVVDDGSTDNSREILEKYKNRIKIILKENGGQASAFNVGISEAQGEIICFLDSDDFWKADKVETVVKKYSESEWGLVCHRIVEFDNEKYNAESGHPPSGEINKNYIHEGDALEYSIEHGYDWIFHPTSAISMPTKIAKLLIPLPELNWRINADAPLAFGASCYAPVGVINRPLGYYRFHGKNVFLFDRNKNNVRFRILTRIMPIQRYLYLLNHIGNNSRHALKIPDSYYPDFRGRVLALSSNPLKRLLDLYIANIIFHSGLTDATFILMYKICRWLIIDTLAILAITMDFSPKWKQIRMAAKEILSNENHQVKKYCRKY